MHDATRRVITDPTKLWQLLRESVSAWIDDYAPSMGAAISYYTIFSIAPLLLIVIAVVGFVFGREAASGQIFLQLRGLMGDAGAAAIEGLVKSASDPAKGGLATLIGVVMLLFGATTVFAELQSSLDRIWQAPAAAKKEGLWTLVRSRILSFGMILGIGFLLLVSLVVSAGISALGSMWGPLFGGSEMLLQVVNFAFSLVVVTVLFAMIYKLLPRAHIGWRDVWIGASVTSLLFSIGKFLIGLYIGKSSVVSGFGAAGSLAVVLIWVYYSAQIFLLGAEFTWVYAYHYGSRRRQPVPESGHQPPSHSAAPAPKPGAPGRGARTAARLPGVAHHATSPGPAGRALRFVRRHPGLELGLAVAVAGLAALWRGRPR